MYALRLLAVAGAIWALVMLLVTTLAPMLPTERAPWWLNTLVGLGFAAFVVGLCYKITSMVQRRLGVTVRVIRVDDEGRELSTSEERWH